MHKKHIRKCFCMLHIANASIYTYKKNELKSLYLEYKTN